MEPRVQRRIQRYGWDLAAREYEPLWQAQLAAAHVRLMQCASLAPGHRVVDIACGSGLITLPAAAAVGPGGEVVGVDLSSRMVDSARRRARAMKLSNASFQRMDAEQLDLPDASFDAAVCALGLMFMPDPAQAVREMRRVLRPGGRLAIAVWGERKRCAWAALFPIVDEEVASDVCPLFFNLGQDDTLACLCASAGFEAIEQHRIVTTLEYADADAACSAAFIGGPVALAWSRFDDRARARVRARYLASIAPWRRGDGYRLPGEFVVVSASVPAFR